MRGRWLKRSRRLDGQVVELELVGQEVADGAVLASSSRSSQKKSFPASAASTFSSWRACPVPPWRRVPCSTATVSPRPPAPGWMRVPAQPKRPGSNARRQRAPRPPARSTPAMAWASPRAEKGPCNSPLAPWPVATQALPQPGSRPTNGPVVRRGGTEPDPGLEVVAPLRPGRHGQALAEQLVETRRGHADREAGGGLEGAAAGDPPAGPGHEVVGQQRLNDRPLPRLRPDPEMHDLSLGRAHGKPRVRAIRPPRPSRRPRRRRPHRRRRSDALRPRPPRTWRAPLAPASTPWAAPATKATPRAEPPPAGAPPPCRARRPAPSAGACSTRCTGPSGGKRELASSGVISATSPGERRSTISAKGANHSFLGLAQAEGEDRRSGRNRPRRARRRRRPGGPAAPGSAPGLPQEGPQGADRSRDW